MSGDPLIRFRTVVLAFVGSVVLVVVLSGIVLTAVLKVW